MRNHPMRRIPRAAKRTTKYFGHKKSPEVFNKHSVLGFVLVALIASLGLLAWMQVGTNLTGLFTSAPTIEQNFTVSVSGTATYPVNLSGDPTALHLTGRLLGAGRAIVYFESDGQQWLVVDTDTLDLGGNLITGDVVSNETINTTNATTPVENNTEALEENAESNQTQVNSTEPTNATQTNVTQPVANTTQPTINSTQSQQNTTQEIPQNTTQTNSTETNETEQSTAKTIDPVFNYASGTQWDVHDNGIELIDNVIDVSLQGTTLSWNGDASKICTRWTIRDSQSFANTICTGSSDCCVFLGELPEPGLTWESLTIYNGLYGSDEDSTIGAQVLYYDVDLNISNLKTDIVYAPQVELPLRWMTDSTLINNHCAESCTLAGAKNEGQFVISVTGDAVLEIDSFSYTTATNRAPEWFGPENITIQENGNYTEDIRSWFIDPEGQSVSVTVQEDVNLNTTIDDNLTIVPDSDFTGEREITLYGYDGNKTKTQRLPVYVISAGILSNITNATNETPTIRFRDKEGNILNQNITADNVKLSATRSIVIPPPPGILRAATVEEVSNSIEVIGARGGDVLTGYLDELDTTTSTDTISRNLGTDVVALPAFNFTVATIALEKTGPINALVECPDFNFTDNSCPEWIKSDTPYTENVTHILFNVTHFSGYGGANISIINVQSYPAVGGNWTVFFDTNGTANLTIIGINGTTFTEYPVDNETTEDDLAFLSLHCGNQSLNYSRIMNGSKMVGAFYEDYSCDVAGSESSFVKTSGKHHLEFTFGIDKGYANNDATTLLITGTTEVCGDQTEFDTVIVTSTGIMNICANDGTIAKGWVNFSLNNGNFTVESGGIINGTGRGGAGGSTGTSTTTCSDQGVDGENLTGSSASCSANNGGGSGALRFGTGDSNSGAGGGFGGAGGRGGESASDTQAIGGGSYGSVFGTRLYIGSGGGGQSGDSSSLGTGGAGGGALRVSAGEINIQGTILMNGEQGLDGDSFDDSGGGGGSGGHVIFNTTTLNLDSGVINVSGGRGGDGAGSSSSDSCGGGGGGGGRLLLAYSTISTTSFVNDTSGGPNGTSTDSACQGGSAASLPGTDGSEGHIRSATLVITETIEFCGDVTGYSGVIVESGGNLSICDFNGSIGTGYVNFTLSSGGNFTIKSGGVVDGIGAGAFGGDASSSSSVCSEPGVDGETNASPTSQCTANGGGGGGGQRGGTSDSIGGSGGAFDGVGGDGGRSSGTQSSGGEAYGTFYLGHVHIGSGGGGQSGDTTSLGDGGAGGGGFRIFAPNGTINVQGNILVHGLPGADGDSLDDSGGGGGSGGHIVLDAFTLNLDNGLLNASGAAGGDASGTTSSDSCGGGGGGGGRILLKYNTVSLSNYVNDTLGGREGIGTDATCDPGSGSTESFGGGNGTEFHMINDILHITDEQEICGDISELTGVVVKSGAILHACSFNGELDTGYINLTLGSNGNFTVESGGIVNGTARGASGGAGISTNNVCGTSGTDGSTNASGTADNCSANRGGGGGGLRPTLQSQGGSGGAFGGNGGTGAGSGGSSSSEGGASYGTKLIERVFIGSGGGGAGGAGSRDGARGAGGLRVDAGAGEINVYGTILMMGGGGETTTQSGDDSGGGAGSGGHVILDASTVRLDNGVINVSGGRGGDSSGTASSDNCGGGGGGGGRILIKYATISLMSYTNDTSGGSAGNNADSGCGPGSGDQQDGFDGTEALVGTTDLIIDQEIELCGQINDYTKVTIKSGGILSICDFDGTNGTGFVNLSLGSNGNFTVESGGIVNGTGRGGRGGVATGGTSVCSVQGESGNTLVNGSSSCTNNDGGGGGSLRFTGNSVGGSGGAFGGNGGRGGASASFTGAVGEVYGTAISSLTLGSGGSGAAGASSGVSNGYDGGDGGGAFGVHAGSGEINIQGTIHVTGAQGLPGDSTDDSGGGGGSGGHVILNGATMNLENGNINVSGGRGGDADGISTSDSCGGGGGGGGRILLQYTTLSSTGYRNSTAGGLAGTGTDSNCDTEADSQVADAGSNGTHVEIASERLLIDTPIDLCGNISEYTGTLVKETGVINVCEFESSLSEGFVNFDLGSNGNFTILNGALINLTARGGTGGTPSTDTATCSQQGASGQTGVVGTSGTTTCSENNGGGSGARRFNSGDSQGGSGGGFGGAGGVGGFSAASSRDGGHPYGTATSNLFIGSGGGGQSGTSSSLGDGGVGGGGIKIIAGEINMHGTIRAFGTAGEDSGSNDNSGGGGGSGGHVILEATTLRLDNGVINVSGGKGGDGFGLSSSDSCGGGGGAGGRIQYTYTTLSASSFTNDTRGGDAGTGTDTNCDQATDNAASEPGENGTVVHVSAETLIVNTVFDFCGDITNVTNVIVTSSGVINVCPFNGTGTGYVNFSLGSNGNFTVESGGIVNATGRGGTGGHAESSTSSCAIQGRDGNTGQFGTTNCTPNGGGGGAAGRDDSGSSAGGGGGAFAGPGGRGGDSSVETAGPGGLVYDLALGPLQIGSGGGGQAGDSESLGDGGAGAGSVRVVAGNISIQGTVLANGVAGADGDSTDDSGGGGGSGGHVVLIANTINLDNGVINVSGGAGGGDTAGTTSSDSCGGGGGGGGAIVLDYTTLSLSGYVNDTSGGNAGPGTDASCDQATDARVSTAGGDGTEILIQNKHVFIADEARLCGDVLGYTGMIVESGGTVTICNYNGTGTGFVNLTLGATGNFTVESGGIVNGTGAGAVGGAAESNNTICAQQGFDSERNISGVFSCSANGVGGGGSAAGSSESTGGAGGGFGGRGGIGGESTSANTQGAGGLRLRDQLTLAVGASGGGQSGAELIEGIGGSGAGSVRIAAGNISVQGSIFMVGGAGHDGDSSEDSGGGGGSGGHVILEATTINLDNGLINVSGGAGGDGEGSTSSDSCGGGGGGGGIIVLKYTLLSTSGYANHTDGGSQGSAVDSSCDTSADNGYGSDGGDGTEIHIEQNTIVVHTYAQLCEDVTDYSEVVVKENAVLSICPHNSTGGYINLTLGSDGNFTVETDAVVNATARGTPGGQGLDTNDVCSFQGTDGITQTPGSDSCSANGAGGGGSSAATSESTGGAGGGLGGPGGVGGKSASSGTQGTGGSKHTIVSTLAIGSGGGGHSGDSSLLGTGGRGAASIRVEAGNISIQGSILATGEKGAAGDNGADSGGGGGSGGHVILDTTTLNLDNGVINVSGGAGGDASGTTSSDSCGGGGGGGGIIYLNYTTLSQTNFINDTSSGVEGSGTDSVCDTLADSFGSRPGGGGFLSTVQSGSLFVDSRISLCGNVNQYSTIVVRSGGIIDVCAVNGSGTGYVNFSVGQFGNFTVESGGIINATGKGGHGGDPTSANGACSEQGMDGNTLTNGSSSCDANGGGAGGSAEPGTESTGGSGGGFGGVGGIGGESTSGGTQGTAGQTYGSAFSKRIKVGSGGSGQAGISTAVGFGGDGGGGVRIAAGLGEINIQGIIYATGEVGIDSDASLDSAGGGGSGGHVILSAQAMNLDDGFINVSGGRGGDGIGGVSSNTCGGGGGGGGRIVLDYTTLSQTNFVNDTSGGAAGTGGDSECDPGSGVRESTAGSAGTIAELSTQFSFGLVRPRDGFTSSLDIRGSFDGVLKNQTSYSQNQNITLNNSNGSYIRFRALFATELGVNLTTLRVFSAEGKMAVNTTGVTGVAPGHTLFLRQNKTTGVFVCPHANNTDEVVSNCDDVVTFTYTEALVGTTKAGLTANIVNSEWVVDNVTGSGMGEAQCSGTDPPANGDWNVADSTSCENGLITMNGNVSIANGANLTLNNVTLTMNTTGFQLRTINNSGRFYVNNSNITAANTSGYEVYEFITGATGSIAIRNSQVHHAGVATSGVYIQGGNSRIENSSIYPYNLSSLSAIYIVHGQNVSIIRSYIETNASSSNAVLLSNTSHNFFDSNTINGYGSGSHAYAVETSRNNTFSNETVYVVNSNAMDTTTSSTNGNITITNGFFNTTAASIQVDGGSNYHFKNNTFIGGFGFSGGENAIVSDFTVEDTSSSAVVLSNVDDTLIKDGFIQSTGSQAIVATVFSRNASLVNLTIHSVGNGIEIGTSTDNVTMINVTVNVTGDDDAAIYVTDGEDHSITNAIVYSRDDTTHGIDTDNTPIINAHVETNGSTSHGITGTGNIINHSYVFVEGSNSIGILNSGGTARVLHTYVNSSDFIGPALQVNGVVDNVTVRTVNAIGIVSTGGNLSNISVISEGNDAIQISGTVIMRNINSTTRGGSREALQIAGASHDLRDLILETTGSSSPVIELAATDSIIDNITVTSSGDTSEGIEYTSLIDRTVVSNATIITTGVGSPGVSFEFQGSNANFTYSTITTNGSDSYGARFDSASSNRPQNNTLHHVIMSVSHASDVFMDVESENVTNYFINVTFNQSNTTYIGDPSGNLDVAWPIRGFVNSTTSSALQNANVTLRTVSNSIAWTALTDSNGLTEYFTTTQYLENNTGRFTNNLHTASATATGFALASQTHNVSATATLSFELGPCTGTQPPIAEDWIIQDTTVCEHRVLILNGNLTIEAGANLTFENVTLIFNTTLGDKTLNNSGNFSINNSNLTVANESINSGEEFRFFTLDGGYLELKNSFVTHAGDGSGSSNTYYGRGINLQEIALIENTTVIGSNITNGWGIYANSDSGILIRNVNVSTFGSTSYGIRFRSVSSSVIENSVIVTNGTANMDGIYIENSGTNNITDNLILTHGTSGGIGIMLHQTSSNLVFNNSIATDGSSSFNYGIRLFGSLVTNTLSFNTINTSGTNDNYGFHIDSASRNTFLNNVIHTSGSSNDNFGMYIEESDNNSMSGNNITTLGSATSHGLYFVLDSEHNVVENTNIKTTNTTSAGVYFESLGGSNRPDNNTIKDSFINTTVGDSVTLDSGSNAIVNYFVNVTFNASKIGTTGTSGRIDVGWWTQAFVNSTDGVLENTNVTAHANDSVVEWSSLTGSNGFTNFFATTEFIEDNTGRSFKTNYSYIVSGTPYLGTTIEHNVTESTTINFSLGRCIGTAPPTSGDWVITDSTQCNSLKINLNGNLSIRSGGQLTLSNVTLLVNTSDFNSREINNSGIFIVNNSNISSMNSSVESNESFRFYTEADGRLEMRDSYVYHAGDGFESAAIPFRGKGLNIQGAGSFVRNTSIFSAPIVDVAGLAIYGVDGINVTNNYIETNGSDGDGVYLADADYNYFDSNTVITNALGAAGYYFDFNAGNNTIANESIRAISSIGVQVPSSSTNHNNTFINVFINGSTGINFAGSNSAFLVANSTIIGQICLCSGGSNSKFKDFTLQGNVHATGADNVVFDHGTITVPGSSTIGARLRLFSDRHNFTNVTIHAEDEPIEIDQGTRHTLFVNVTVNSTGDNDAAVDLVSGNNVTFIGGIVASRADNTPAIIDNGVTNITVIGTTVITNGTSSNAIEGVDYVENVKVYVSGSSSYGIFGSGPVIDSYINSTTTTAQGAIQVTSPSRNLTVRSGAARGVELNGNLSDSDVFSTGHDAIFVATANTYLTNVTAKSFAGNALEINGVTGFVGENLKLNATGSNNPVLYSLATGGVLENATLTSNGTDSEGIQLLVTMNISNVSITTHGADSPGLRLESLASNTTISHAWINTSGAKSYGVHFENPNGQNPDNTSLRHVVMQIWNASDVFMDLENENLTVNFINVTFNQSNVTYIGDPSGTLDVAWPIRGFTNDSLGATIQNANVTLTTVNSAITGTALTDSNGFTRFIDSTQYLENNTGRFTSNLYTATASAPGYADATQQHNASVTATISFTLGPCEGTNPPNSGDWIIADSTFCDSEVITLNGNITISSGANLTFENVTLIFNTTLGDKTLDNDGQLAINHSNITVTNETFDSDEEFRFMTDSAARLVIKNSIVRHAGDGSGSSPTFTGYGINIHGNSSQVINNTIIASNINDGVGVFLHAGSNNTISHNNITTNGSDGIGVYIRSSNNNTILQNTIFTSGGSAEAIELFDAYDSTVINNSLRATNLFADGVMMTGAFNSYIYNNSITTGDGDAISLSSSNDSIIGNNTLTPDSAGVRVASSHSNLISNNSITATDGNGLALVTATFNTFRKNDIAGVSTSNAGITFSTTSSYNVFWFNTIVTQEADAHGYFITADSDYNNITGGTVETLGAEARAVYFLESGGASPENNTFRDIFINSSLSSDVNTSLANVTATNYFINVSFNKSKAAYGSGPSGQLDIAWLAQAFVNSSSGPVENATVSAFTNASILEWTTTTDSNGFTPYFATTEYIQNNSGQFFETNYTFNASKVGVGSVSKQQNITDSITVNLTLINNPPTVTSVILNSSALLNKTGENLTAHISGVEDLDQDNVKNISQWLLNSSSITILHLPFEGGSTSGVAGVNGFTKDYSPTETNGSVFHAQFNATAGFDGFGAYIFNGSTYIDLDDSLDDTFAGSGATFTIAAWIKPNATMTNNYIVAKLADSTCSANQREFALRLFTGSQLEFLWYGTLGTTSFRGVLGTTALTNINEWYHIAVTYDGSGSNSTNRVSLFVNGIQEDVDEDLNGGAIGDIQNGAAHLGIAKNLNTAGTECGSDDRFFNGSIDEVYIYNRTLSAAQIFALYQNKTTTLVSDETVKGDIWQNCVTPNDGKTDGSEVCSNNLTILNTAPQIVSALLNTSPFNINGTAENVSVHIQVSDGDSDPVNFSVIWTKNGRAYPSTVGNLSATYRSVVLNVPFENYSANNDTFKDFSLVQRNATLIGAPFWNSTGGYDGFGAYQFDGSADYLDFGDDDAYSNSTLTVIGWFKTATTDANERTIISKYSSQTGDVEFSIVQRNDEIRFFFDDSGSGNCGGDNCYDSTTDSANIVAGDWYHLALTFDDVTDEINVFINGVNQSYTQSAGGTPSVSNQPSSLKIGEMICAGGSCNYFSGSLDNFQVYTVVLSNQEIDLLYRNKTSTIVSSETEVNEVWNACATPFDADVGEQFCSQNLTIVNNPPDIIEISNFTTSIIEASVRRLNFSVVVEDNDTTAGIIVNLTISFPNETVRANTSCSLQEQISSVRANYSCVVPLWFFDGPGLWDANATVRDTGGLTNQDNQTFFVLGTFAVQIGPSNISWADLAPGGINQTSIENLTINNTGNLPFGEGEVVVNASDLMGQADATHYIPAGNFSISSLPTPQQYCARTGTANQTLNNTAIVIANANLTVGNFSDGLGFGQEVLTICLREVPQTLISQSYVTARPWDLRLG